MMITILSLLLFIVFTFLSLIHFYWLLGGKWGLNKVIPTKEYQANIISIPKFATFLVGAVLMIFGILYLVKSGLVNFEIPGFLLQFSYWFIPSIFVLRAMGEFKYVGFFKKIKNTVFAKADTKYFSPLCLGIGVIGIVLQLLV